MGPFKNINTYFNNMDTIYEGTNWADCTTQAELNHALIREISPDSTKFVTKIAFDSVSAIVAVAIEDWPAAIGSVFSVITDIYQLIGSKSFHNETKNFKPILEQLDALNSAIQSLNTRVFALETQNQNQNR